MSPLLFTHIVGFYLPSFTRQDLLTGKNTLPVFQILVPVWSVLARIQIVLSLLIFT